MLRIEKPHCSGPSCKREVRANGLCSAHNLQQHRGAPLVQLRGGSAEKRAPCKGPDCTRESVCQGLCGGHYQQLRKGIELRPLRRIIASTYRSDDGLRPCRSCHRWLDVSDFYPIGSAADGLSSTCKRCDRNYRLIRHFGITIDRYEEMLSAQGGRCAICKGEPTAASLAVDHDHSCCPQKGRSCGKCVRGLLCEDCNRGIGMMKDSVSILQSAIEYLS